MIEICYDLHIHSVLSPCADRENTLHNIINMAYIKNLSAISVTDHNACFNQKVAAFLANQRGILYVPGIEVQTVEEVHLLCYFRKVAQAEAFGELIYASLPQQEIKAEIFGEQWVLSEEDEIRRKESKNLLNSSAFTIDEIYDMVRAQRGALVPAHIDKPHNSIISQMGFIPMNWHLEAVEISQRTKDEMLETLSFAKDYLILRNSDAHMLNQINEPHFVLQIERFDVDGIVDALGGGRL